MNVNEVFRAEKPVSVWNRPLKLSFREFFKGLTSAVAGVASGKIDTLPNALLDIVTSVRVVTKPEELAWLLVYRAVTASIYELVNESIDMFESPPEDLDKFFNQLDFSLEDQPVIIDNSLFLHPGDLPLLDGIRLVMQEWLTSYGIVDAQAVSIEARLRSYFVYALNAEWRKRPQDYAPITKFVNTPFTKAEEREQAWNQYDAWLQKEIDASMFGEAFSLSQVYIPLRAYYEERDKTNDAKGADHSVQPEQGEGSVCHVVDLQTALDKWLKKKDRLDSIRVISGGPGCGKSSFAKMYAAHIAQAGETRVLFVPLHKFELKDDMIQAVGDFVVSSDHFNYNPLDPIDGEKRLLIIFDGLDESSKQGKVGAEIAQQFVREVEKRVEVRNERELHLQVLLSGRALFVQANASEFRKHEEVLHMLPYCEPESFGDHANDPDALLKIDQRDLWWRKYGVATGKKYEAMPEEFKSQELQDITTEPLLNYLFALSYTGGELRSGADVSLNDIYEALLKRVYHRGYGENRLRKSIPEMSEAEFFCVLEEIGLAAWHGGGRTTTIKEIMNCCDASGTGNLLGKFQEGAEKGVTRLLAAFYFREAGEYRGAERTIEFTHKSFGEYLAVRRMMRLLRIIPGELKRHAEVQGAGWDYRDALERWAWLFGPASLDEYLFDFVCREIQLSSKSDAAGWQRILSAMISNMLCSGMPMEKLRGGLSYLEQKRQARNAEEAMLAFLSASARHTREMSLIGWPDRTSAGAWISLLQGQRLWLEHGLALKCLNYLNLELSALDKRDLGYADLSHSDMRHALAQFTCLYHADLRGTNLEEAHLRNTLLMGANLQGANLQGADLIFADLCDAKLHGANLRDACLTEADLSCATLHDADLRRADLRGASLRWIRCHDADFRNAYLAGADLRYADLRGSSFEFADLESANLEDADLEGANLRDAKVTDEQLSKTHGIPAVLPQEANNTDAHALGKRGKRPGKG